jgi:hypothetical protein
MERTRSGAEVELGDGEHALPFISEGGNILLHLAK